MTDNYVITVVVRDGGGWVELPDQTVPLAPGTLAAMSKQAVGILTEHVRGISRPRDVRVHEGDSVQYLRVSPDGSITVTSSQKAAVHADALPAPADQRVELAPTPAASPRAMTGLDEPPPAPSLPVPAPLRLPDEDPETPSDAVELSEIQRELATPLPPKEAPSTATATGPRPPMISPAEDSIMSRERRSFIDQATSEAPASTGVRGMLARVGLRVEPSAAERAEREDKRAVAQHWPGKRTIAIVNGKGGAGKTPATVALSAIFAHYGGSGVVAWDNNQNRGTLGWRTEQGPHDATLLDMLPSARDLLGPQSEAADIARFVHHQTEDKFDVLRSQPMLLRDEQRLGLREFDSIHKVLAKYYRLIFIDSGNDESDTLWGRMIDHADQIVVATTTRGDIAEAGALLLEALGQRDEHAAGLARNAVVVVSQANEHAPGSEAEQIAKEFSYISRTTVTIPFDRGLVEGHLHLSNLRPGTRRAWLTAGAAVARGL